MSREPLPDRELARLLDEQIDAMQAVLAALEAERDALTRRDGDALLQAIDSKAARVASAETIEERRQALISSLGIPLHAGRRGREFSADAGIASRWQQVVALTERCRAVNEANGRLIRGQRRRVDGTLRILRGESADAVEYGPAGEKRNRNVTRSLGSF
jgi:flagella synthesis protein FlgN